MLLHRSMSKRAPALARRIEPAGPRWHLQSRAQSPERSKLHGDVAQGAAASLGRLC